MPGYDIPIVGPILNKIIGTRNERWVKRYMQKVSAINSMEAQIRRLTDLEITGKLEELRKRHDNGATSDELLPEAFAVAREAMDRNVGIRNIFNPKFEFDVSRLSPAHQDLYRQTRERIDAMQPAEPSGAFLGGNEPVPPHVFADIPLELYEAVRELYPDSKPPFRARPFDVQLIGAMVLYQGKIAEMRTGEGKTIVGPLACYLACAERYQVHVVTVNDYLVQRDRDWTMPFFNALGLRVGAIHPQHMQPEDVKRQMYRCDVVYGTTAEFGFDYLRDNMKSSEEQQVQRKRHFAIVDEVDSTLIDEARTPLIISGAAHEDEPRYELADRLARHLLEKHKPWAEADEAVQECVSRIKGFEGDIRQASDRSKVPALARQLEEAKKRLPGLEATRGQHTQYYEVKPERKQAHITHEGIAEAQRVAGLGSFYVGENIDMPHLLSQAVRAYAVYQRDRDYIVAELPDQMTGRPTPSVVIVDVNTGRPMVGRQWSDGLHQAVECKERVPIKQETQTVATITIQNYFKMYRKLAGMTGTADTEAQEFHDIYKLDVVSIPTNRPMVRRDFDDLVFLRGKDKWNAIVDEIKAFHDVGRPILVGTTSVENSEMLGKLLTEKYGIAHEILNAKQHDREAHIIENAGQLGAVMIATNMAGRGTDIKLGNFTRRQVMDHWLLRSVAPADVPLDADDTALKEAMYRKMAPQELNLPRRETDAMSSEELELALLRVWAGKFSLIEAADVGKLRADELREALDSAGRCILHRMRWFENIEDMGGLHVIGTERHESRRIDNQLRGRSGRQGDRGSSRFYIAMDEGIMKQFASETMNAVLAKLGMKEGVAIEHPWLSKSVERAQRKVEEHFFQVRKNLLEYDEVMEHQRQTFFGLRQRVIEGRDVNGLLLDFVENSVHKAVKEYLDPDYPSVCAAEFARQRLDVSIHADKLRGLAADELMHAIKADAKYDARQSINLTLGEFMTMEGSEVAVDFDSAGLINWARSKFGVELDPAQLRAGGADERRIVLDALTHAAEEKIEHADLSGIEIFGEKSYGPAQLCEWANRKYGMTVTPEEILAAMQVDKPAAGEEDKTPSGLLMAKARELFRKREIEEPVEFALQMTMLIAQQSRDEAASQLVTWANRKYQFGWTPEELRKSTPAKVKGQLVEANTKFVDEHVMDKEIAAAQACKTDDELAEHFKKRFEAGWPDDKRHLPPEERPQAIRARVENILRAELLYKERQIFLDVLDNSWKDHLYAMDQLRESIGFRAFSQQDPRIEYKREGSQMFKAMLENLRDRITDLVFKTKVNFGAPRRPAPMRGPGGGMRMAPGPVRPQVGAAPEAAPGGEGAGGPDQSGGGGAPPAAGGTITGPGMGSGDML